MNEEKRKELKTYLLSLVAKREYTQKQLRDKAYSRYPGTAQETLSAILKEFEEKKFVSDQRFAELYTRQAIQKGDGPLKIQQKLYQKGINSDMASQILEDHYPQELQIEIAQKVVIKKDGQSTDKKARFLASRGFESGIVWEVVKSYQ